MLESLASVDTGRFLGRDAMQSRRCASRIHMATDVDALLSCEQARGI